MTAPPPEFGPVRLRVTRAAVVWAAVAVVLAAVGWYKTINLLLLGGYALLAAVAVNAVVARRAAGRVRAEFGPVPVRFPRERVAVPLTVTNPSAGPVTVRVDIAGGPNRSAFLFAPLAAGGSAGVTADWAFPARGAYPVGPAVVDAAAPFGLIHAVRPLTGVAVARVLPEPGRVDVDQFRRWLVRGGAGDGPARRPSRRAAPGTGDVRGLRPYRPGDSPREVHWRSSARRNQLLVREYDRTEPLDMVLVIDPYLPPGANPAAADRLEWCLSLAVTLGLAWAAADTPAMLTLVVPTPGGPVTGTGRASVALVRAAFAPLADVIGMADVPPVPLSALGRNRRAARLLLTPRDGSPLLGPLQAGGSPVRAVTPGGRATWFTAAGASPPGRGTSPPGPLFDAEMG